MTFMEIENHRIATNRGKVMGPDKEALDLARHLIEKYGLSVELYDFAYAIQSFAEEHFDDEQEKQA